MPNCVTTLDNTAMPMLRFASLSAQPGFRHGFTTRHGGVSPAPYDSLNLSQARPDAKSNTAENYRRLCESQSLDERALTLVNYAHGDGVVEVRDEDAGRGWHREPLPPCDALISRSTEAVLMTLHADCLSVFFYDPVRRAAGLAHAGWKGCALSIGAKTLRAMEEKLGSKSQDVICCIGPGICQKCFEVDAPVAEAFLRYPAAVVKGEKGKYHVDLAHVMRAQLLEAGAVQIEDAGLCTHCRRDLFFSHRRDAGKTGAMAAYMKLET